MNVQTCRHSDTPVSFHLNETHTPLAKKATNGASAYNPSIDNVRLDASKDANALIAEDLPFFDHTASGKVMYAPFKSRDESVPLVGSKGAHCFSCKKELSKGDPVFYCEMDSSSKKQSKPLPMCEKCYLGYDNPGETFDKELSQLYIAGKGLCYRYTLNLPYGNEFALSWAKQRRHGSESQEHAGKRMAIDHNRWMRVTDTQYVSHLRGHCKFLKTLEAINRRCPRAELVVEVFDARDPRNSKSDSYSWERGLASWDELSRIIDVLADEVKAASKRKGNNQPETK